MSSKDNIVNEEEKRWIAYLNGEVSQLEYSELDEKKMSDLTGAWENAGTAFSYAVADPDKGWSELQKKLGQPEKILKIKFYKSRFFQYAATLVVTLGIGFGTWQLIKAPKEIAEVPIKWALAETTAHPDSTTRIVLPDGSIVKLNANTKLEYPERFSAHLRTVKLSGEAFFEVTKDSLHPFKIEMANAAVVVLGTSFNVSAYPGADRVEVNVETGKVKLIPLTGERAVGNFAILPAGYRGCLKLSNGELNLAKALSPNYSAWITKVISFQRTPLAEVCTTLENTYHIKFRLEDPEIGKIRYTANFARLDPDYIVEVIARTHHLQVKKEGDEILLAKRRY